MTTMDEARLLEFLATYAVHSTLLLGSAAVLGRWIVRRESWREAVWKAALVGAVITSALATAAPWTPFRIELPALSSAFVESESAGRAEAMTRSEDGDGVPMDPEAARRPAAATEGSVSPVGKVPSIGEGTPPTPSERAGSAAQPAGWIAVLLVAWLVGAVALLARLAWRHVRLRTVLRGRRQVTERGLPAVLAELRRSAGVWVPVRLTATDAVSSPLVLGRWEICVPERFVTELGAAEQRSALAHELGHLARRDPWWQLAAAVLECLFFFQPLQRLGRRALRETAEYLADGWAVRQVGGRLSLARSLAEVAGWVAPRDAAALAASVAMAEGGSPLLSRVSRLLEREPETEPGRGARAVAGLAMVAVAACVAPAVGGQAEQSAGLAEPAGATLEADAGLDGDAELDGGIQAEVDVVRLSASGGLAEAIRGADAEARQAGGTSYWVAWSVDSRIAAGSQVSMDSGPWQRMGLQNAGLASTLGVADEIGRADGTETALLLARLVPDGPVTRLDRLALRTPSAGMALSGTVYWLGARDEGETFTWLRGRYDEEEDPELVETALDAASVLPVPDVAVFLRTEALTGRGHNIREQAVEGLVYHPTDATLAVLVRLAEEDADERIRAEAAETLGELDHAGALPALRALAVDPGAGRVRGQAIEGLVGRQDPELAALLLDLALHDGDPDVRREAVELMGNLPPAEAIALLRRVVFESGDGTSERQSAETLGDVGTPGALSVLDEIIERNPGEEASFQAVESIAEGFAPDLAIPRLRRIARDHPSSRVRREALEQLTDLVGRP